VVSYAQCSIIQSRAPIDRLPLVYYGIGLGTSVEPLAENGDKLSCVVRQGMIEA
jgi:hypothetical protein